MSDVLAHTLRLVRTRARFGSRWARENGFTLFVMGPLVIGGAGVIFQPSLEAAGRVIREGAAPWLDAHLGTAAGLLAVALVLARFSSAVRDAFALDGDDFYLDALPIPPLARLHDVLLVRVFKALPVALGLFFALYMAAPPGARLARVAADLAPELLLAAALLAVVETGAALALVRLRLTSPLGLAAAALAAAGIVVAAGPVAGWLAMGSAVAAYAVAAVGFLRWRVEDRDRAREALARARRTSADFERLADRMLGPRVGAQFVRDLRLVRRGFSTTPYVSLGVAAVLPALAVWLDRRYALSAEQTAHMVEGATVLASFALASVTHALVGYERTRIWIDLTSGVEREAFPIAKVWLARALAVPALLFGLGAALASGVELDGLEFIKLVWLAWSTASMTALFCYELKERPAAGLVLAFIAAVGLAMITVFYGRADLFFYVGLFIYFYATFWMGERASTKVTWE